jgi:hypothetical protein
MFVSCTASFSFACGRGGRPGRDPGDVHGHAAVRERQLADCVQQRRAGACERGVQVDQVLRDGEPGERAGADVALLLPVAFAGGEAFDFHLLHVALEALARLEVAALLRAERVREEGVRAALAVGQRLVADAHRGASRLGGRGLAGVLVEHALDALGPLEVALRPLRLVGGVGQRRLERFDVGVLAGARDRVTALVEARDGRVVCGPQLCDVHCCSLGW